MIASEYLDFRARLDGTLGALAEAARRSGVHPGRPALMRNLVVGLKDPFMFVLAGEAGAGKSTFLNALASEQFCDASEGAVDYYKFGEQECDVPAGAGLVEKYRPCEFLRDFHLVEVPGAEGRDDVVSSVAERFVPMADLVLVVISAADAWRPGVWRSLDHVHLGLGKDVLLVLTGCDQRSEEEVRAVVEHMELTMKRRYRRGLPIFQMSAEPAFLARTNPAGGGDKKLAESGILALEEHITHRVMASDARMERFANALKVAHAVLDELRDPLAETEEILGRDGDLLASIKTEINERYEKTNAEIRGEFFDGLDAGHAAAVDAAQAQLTRATGWGAVPALALRGAEGVVPEGLGKNFSQHIAETTERRIVDVMSAAEADVGGLWETLSARVGEEFDHQLSAGDGTGKAVWSGRGENLLRRADACAHKACADFSITEAVTSQLSSAAGGLRFFLASAIVLVVGTVVLFALNLGPAPYLVGGLTLVALGFGAGQFLDNRRRLKAALADRAEAGRIQLRADLNSELTSHVHEYYTRLGVLFDPVQELCQQQVEEVAPQITALRGLDAEVADLSQELETMREHARAQMLEFEKEQKS